MGKLSAAAAALVVVVLSLVIGACHAITPGNYPFVREATTAPPLSYYDYIIVGGGTAGCPLAATLSSASKVLLLERGGSPYGNPNITNLSGFADTLSDTSPFSAAQRFVSEDGVINSRARVLGGGSCLNAGFYTRAADDYVHDAGWNATMVADAYRWVERDVAFQPPMLQWQQALRDGLIEAGITPFRGFTYDHLVGTKVGGTIFDRDGHRHTAADLLQRASVENLTVLLHATTMRVLFRRRNVAVPTAHGVVFRDATGQLHRAYLNRGVQNEVIVSAGAMGSPQLLILSGVGPSDQIQRLHVTPVINNSAVGQGMADNPMNAIFVPSPAPVEVSLIQVVGITPAGSYIEGASGANFANRGPGATRDVNLGIFSPQTGQLGSIPPKLRTPEAITQVIQEMQALPDETLRGGFILEKVLGPVSTGSLQVLTRDPEVTPSVMFNYFQDPEDLRRCVEGLRTIQSVIQSHAFSNFRYPYLTVEGMMNITAAFPINLRPKHGDEATSLEEYCRDTVMTIWHYHGGCQVDRVVDREYRVIGADQLRVIDGSTFNYSPGTNPQATVMMLGRYMGMRILSERLQ